MRQGKRWIEDDCNVDYDDGDEEIDDAEGDWWWNANADGDDDNATNTNAPSIDCSKVEAPILKPWPNYQSSRQTRPQSLVQTVQKRCNNIMVWTAGLWSECKTRSCTDRRKHPAMNNNTKGDSL